MYRVHVSGFSCKDLSKLTKNRKAGRSALPQKSGTSGVTLSGLLELLEAHSRAIILLENVDDLLSTSSPNYAFVIKALERRGYISEAREVVSSEFGVCQRRKRAYLIGFKIVRSKPEEYTEGALKRALDLALSFRTQIHETNQNTFKFDGVPVSKRLLKPNSEYLQREFARRRDLRIRADTTAEKKEADLWRETNRSTLERMGVSVSECVLPKQEQGELYALLIPRQKLTLGHTYIAHAKFANSDIYQSLGREFVSRDERIISTIVPGSCKWLRKERRLLTGFEALAIQGVPAQVLEYAVRCGYTDGQFMELAGNSFTAEVVAAFFIAALVEYPLDGEQEDDKLPAISTSVLSALGLS